MKNDIEKFAYEELTLANVLIETIAAKKKSEFVDPFGLEEEKKDASDETPEPVNTKQPPAAAKGKAGAAAAEPPAEEEVDDGSFKYRLGKKQYKDSE